MAKLIFERAFHFDPETGGVKSYWPERWPVPTLREELLGSGSPFFAASYMNDPSALQGNSLKVAWLHYYLPGELEMARKTANVQRGFVYLGADPTYGGKSTDPDYYACMTAEVIHNRAYMLDFTFDRKGVDAQAQAIDDWANTQDPNQITLEETAEEGFVRTALLTQINDGHGTRFSVVTRLPQHSRDPGGKRIRLQALGARAQGAQILFPGVVTEGNHITYDPRWEPFVNQWRTFPAGHDDILDACYWSVYDAFQDLMAAGSGQTATREVQTRDAQGHIVETRVVEVDRRGRPLRPIGAQRDRQSFRGMTHR